MNICRPMAAATYLKQEGRPEVPKCSCYLDLKAADGRKDLPRFRSRREGPCMPAATDDPGKHRILSALQREGRLSNQELADRVGISPSPCWRRGKDLEAAGVIRRYVAILDPRGWAFRNAF